MRALQFKGNDNIKLLASTVSAWGRIEETPHRLSCAVGDFLQRPKLQLLHLSGMEHEGFVSRDNAVMHPPAGAQWPEASAEGHAEVG